MAKLLCHSSAEQLWEVLQKSCQKHAIVSNCDEPTSLIISSPKYRYENWSIHLSIKPSQQQGHTLLNVQPKLSVLTLWIRRLFLLGGVGLLMLGVKLLNHPVLVLKCMSVIGLASGYLILLFYLHGLSLTTRRMKTIFSKVYGDLQSNFRIHLLTPFELRLQPSDHMMFMPLVMIVVICTIVPLTGEIFGIALLIILAYVFMSLLIVKPLLGGWHGILHAMTCFGCGVVIRSSFAIMGVVFVGVIMYVRAFHYEIFEGLPGKGFNEILILAFSNENSDYISSQEMAVDVMQLISPSILLAAAVLIVVACYFCFNLLSAYREVYNGAKYWDSTNVIGNNSGQLISPSANLQVINSFKAFLIVLNALLFGIFYWFAAVVAIEVFVYLLVGQSLIFPLVTWSLEFFKALLLTVGLTAPVAGIIIFIVFMVAALPGLALVVSAITRIFQLGKTELELFYKNNHEDDSWLNIHRSWLDNICQQVNLPQPQLILNESPQALIYSQCSLIPRLRGRIVIASNCRELLSLMEMQVLLAHEVHHLKHDASKVQLLKALSILLLCPVYYLLILYDFARREHDADAFAVEKIGDATVLRAALTKLQVTSNVKQSDHNGWRLYSTLKWFYTWLYDHSRLVRASRLYFSDSIFAAAYPTLPERIRY